MANKPDANRILFEAEFARHSDVVAAQPIEQTVLNDSLASLERAGVNMLAKGDKDALFFAESMKGAYVALSDVEVIPPYTEQQKADHVGKVTVYNTLIESFAEKPKQTKSTPTKGTKTDGRKQ